MKATQTIIAFLALLAMSIGLMALLLTPDTASASANSCGGVQTSIISCDQSGSGSNGGTDTGLWYILILVINILTAGVGVLALAGIVYGAVLYTSAGGNSEQVKKAMGIFTNVVIGVVAFGGMYALLNFLIPGGAFNGL